MCQEQSLIVINDGDDHCRILTRVFDVIALTACDGPAAACGPHRCAASGTKAGGGAPEQQGACGGCHGTVIVTQQVPDAAHAVPTQIANAL